MNASVTTNSSKFQNACCASLVRSSKCTYGSVFGPRRWSCMTDPSVPCSRHEGQLLKSNARIDRESAVGLRCRDAVVPTVWHVACGRLNLRPVNPRTSRGVLTHLQRSARCLVVLTPLPRPESRRNLGGCGESVRERQIQSISRIRMPTCGEHACGLASRGWVRSLGGGPPNFLLFLAVTSAARRQSMPRVDGLEVQHRQENDG